MVNIPPPYWGPGFILGPKTRYPYALSSYFTSFPPFKCLGSIGSFRIPVNSVYTNNPIIRRCVILSTETVFKETLHNVAYLPRFESSPSNVSLQDFRYINTFGAPRTFSEPIYDYFSVGLPDAEMLCFARNCIFSLLPLFWKIKRGLWNHFVVCLCIQPNFCWQAYEITFLSACLWFSVPFVSYQRNTGVYFFP